MLEIGYGEGVLAAGFGKCCKLVIGTEVDEVFKLSKIIWTENQQKFGATNLLKSDRFSGSFISNKKSSFINSQSSQNKLLTNKSDSDDESFYDNEDKENRLLSNNNKKKIIDNVTASKLSQNHNSFPTKRKRIHDEDEDDDDEDKIFLPSVNKKLQIHSKGNLSKQSSSKPWKSNHGIIHPSTKPKKKKTIKDIKLALF